MKKLLLIITAILTLSACSVGDQPSTPPQTGDAEAVPQEHRTVTEDSIEQYVPVKSNTYYEYKSSPTSSANQQVYIAYTNGGRIQRRVTSSFAETTEVLELQSGELRLVYYEPQFYYYENITTVQPTVDMLLLKEPLAVGQTWQMDDTADCEITGMDVPVETEYGSFAAMEVTTVYTTGVEEKAYYVKDLGLVRTIYNTGGQTTIDLAAVTENITLDIPVLFHYPAESGGTEKEERFISFGTNTDLVKTFENEFKTSSADQARGLMSENAVINEMYMDRMSNILYLDMNEAFVKEMDADAERERMILQSIANTLGDFYDIDQVYLTINGKNYDSGQIRMSEGEFIMVEREANGEGDTE